MPRIEAVFFDIGETLVDETREYGTWADWLGVPRHTFSAVFGAVIAQGRDYRDVFQVFRPGFDLAVERERRVEAAQPESFAEDDLYPDARPCLEVLRGQGLRVGLAGNQTARAEQILKALQLPVDVIGTSDGWGVEKPLPSFFDRVIEEAGVPAGSVFVCRGSVGQRRWPGASSGSGDGSDTPWSVGYILHQPDVEGRCLFQVTSLAELPAQVARHNAQQG